MSNKFKFIKATFFKEFCSKLWKVCKNIKLVNVYFELLLKIFKNVFLTNFSYCINSLIKQKCLKLKEQRNKIVFCHFWHQYLLKSKFIAIAWQLFQPFSLCLAQVLTTIALPDPSVTQVLRRNDQEARS